MSKKTLKNVSISNEVHSDFKIYCAQKKITQLDLTTKLIVTEMIKNGFKLSFDAEKHLKNEKEKRVDI